MRRACSGPSPVPSLPGSSFHARDADEFATRYDVPVCLPRWMDRPTDELDAPVERYDAPAGEWSDVGESGFLVRTVDSPVVWREAVAYRPADGTLRVPDLLSPLPAFRVGDERLSCYFLHRLFPPRGTFADVEPDRILFGHGEAVTEDATAALESTLADSRRHLPRALVFQAPHQLRAAVSVLRDDFRSWRPFPVVSVTR